MIEMKDIFPCTDYRLQAEIRERHPALARVVTWLDVEEYPSCMVAVPGTAMYAAYGQDGSLDYILDVELEKQVYCAPISSCAAK